MNGICFIKGKIFRYNLKYLKKMLIFTNHLVINIKDDTIVYSKILKELNFVKSMEI